MPTPTYTALANLTLNGSQSSVTIASISQSYRDLIVVINPSGNQVQDVVMSINGSSSDFSGVRMIGYSGGAGSSTYSNSNGITVLQDNANAVMILQFMDYSATDKHKTILARQNRPNDSVVSATAHRWASTSAITSITFTPTSPYQYISGATFTVYGVAA
jgi:hypothetical protein